MIQKILIFLIPLTFLAALELYEGDPCVDNNSNPGHCRELENCTSVYDDLAKGIRPKRCSGSIKSLLVCCKDSATANRQNVKRLSTRKCEDYTKSVKVVTLYGPLSVNPDVNSVTSAKCNFTRIELIVGGKDADLGEYPHMAAIGWDDVTGYQFKCGGTLISPNFVLTAGHCISDRTAVAPAVVRLGDLNLDPSVVDRAEPIDVPIKSIIKHPKYNSPAKYNDAALIKLERNVEFSNFVRPACLWNKEDFNDNDKAVAIGWGVTDPRTGKTSNMLQKVALSLYGNDICNDILVGLKNRNWNDGLIDTQLCAGEINKGKDTCQGDSGAPLQITARDNPCIFYVIGVTSFGAKQCGHQPAVYTRVSKYLDWIESVVWPGES